MDLQLIFQREELYLPRINKICQLIFRGKNCPPWPSELVKGRNWDSIYDEARQDLPVLPTVDEAIAWANGLIARIAAAQ